MSPIKENGLITASMPSVQFNKIFSDETATGLNSITSRRRVKTVSIPKYEYLNQLKFFETNFNIPSKVV